MKCKDCELGYFHYHYPTKVYQKKIRAFAKRKGLKYHPTKIIVHGLPRVI